MAKKAKVESEPETKKFTKDIAILNNETKDATIKGVKEAMEADKVIIISIGLNEMEKGYEPVSAGMLIHNFAEHEINGIVEMTIQKSVKPNISDMLRDLLD